MNYHDMMESKNYLLVSKIISGGQSHSQHDVAKREQSRMADMMRRKTTHGPSSHVSALEEEPRPPVLRPGKPQQS